MFIVEAHPVCHGHKLFCKYTRLGKPTVILIAGLGDSCDTWKEVQNRISQLTSTLSYDRAGIGKSEGLSVPRTCHDLVLELSELLQSTPVEPPYILVGHSFGGLIARLFASYYPDCVKGIVLVDAIAEYKELAYEKVLPKALIARNRAYLENPMKNSEKIDKGKSYQEVVDHREKSNIPLSIIARGLPDTGHEEWPYQEIWRLEQTMQADFQRLSTNSRFRIAERSGHDIHLDEPEIVIEEIRTMIEGTWGK